jgi:hypothetical protein
MRDIDKLLINLCLPPITGGEKMAFHTHKFIIDTINEFFKKNICVR